MIEFFDCERVLVEGVTIQNPPMWTVHPVLTRGFIMRGVTVRSHTANNDGVDPDMSQDVLITDCDFITSDDGVAIKAGRTRDGVRRQRPTQRVVVRRCTVRAPSKKMIQMGEGVRNGMAIGSEGAAGIFDVWITDCLLVDRRRGLYIKASAHGSAPFERVHVSRITMQNLHGEAIRLSTRYSAGGGGLYRSSGQSRPQWRAFDFEGITSTHSSSKASSLEFECRPGSMEGLTLRDSVFGAKRPTRAPWMTTELTETNVTYGRRPRPPRRLSAAEDVPPPHTSRAGARHGPRAAPGVAPRAPRRWLRAPQAPA